MKEARYILRADRRVWVVRVFLAFSLMLVLALQPSTVSAEIELRLHRVDSYFPHFPAKRKMNRRYRPKLNEMADEMHLRMKAGENLVCASHIFEELHWLVNYTDRTDDIERRMKDLRQSLDDRNAAPAPVQDPKDGSFGACFEHWIWRFFRSVDPLKELANAGKKPDFPLKIWEPVDTPEEIEALMKDLLISDVTGVHNKRKELNLAITALGQLLWLDYTAAVFPEHLDRDALAEALKKFVDEEWQDPDTGYWGAWYRDGADLRKTNDLSITFHIISYRGGQVQKLKELADTTYAIRKVKYPYGWDTGGAMNNHHAYDVTRIINLTWEELDDTARSYANATIFLMTARSLALSINDDGDFDPRPFTTVAEAYYFGVSFFEEIGLFGNETARESAIVVTNTEPLLDQIKQNLAALDASDPWVAATKRKLDGLSK